MANLGENGGTQLAMANFCERPDHSNSQAAGPAAYRLNDHRGQAVKPRAGLLQLRRQAEQDIFAPEISR